MKRNKFSLSFYKLISMKMGGLYPVGLVEVLPGDTFQHSTSALVRAMPLVAPVMHPVHVRIHHWFVPHRLVWSNWESFITGGPDGMDASVHPTMVEAAGPTEGSLVDYLGVPPSGGASVTFSALPVRGYNLIWNEWYRDQDLQTPLTISKADGVDSTTSRVLQNVAWEKDYFTSARPWTQKGPTVTLPLSSTSAPVDGIGISTTAGAPAGSTNVNQTSGAATYTNANPTSSVNGVQVRTNSATPPIPNVVANLSGITLSVSDLRTAMALQRFEEARARYGSRYTEYLRFLGVRSSDARLQRPEYLGGGKQTLQWSEIIQTAPGTAPVGTLKGHGIGAVRSNRYRRFFEEHGYVFSFISVKPKTMYQQGLTRTWSRTVNEDYFQRELQHIGQQSILNKELYVQHATPNGVFGYQDRYDEYRRMESSNAGQFRSTLDYWHMVRKFSSDPVLNASFVASNPTNRIFADQSGSDTLVVMASHSLQARRIVSKVGTSFIF